MDILKKITLFVGGLTFIIVGTIGLFKPQLLLSSSNIIGEGVNAYSEMRATYGGLHFGLGLVLFLSVFVPKIRDFGITTMLVVTTGLFWGRLVSIIMDGFPTVPIVIGTGAAEALGAIVTVIIFFSKKRRRKR